MAGERPHGPAGGRVPQDDGAVFQPDGDVPPVAADGRGVDRDEGLHPDDRGLLRPRLRARAPEPAGPAATSTRRSSAVPSANFTATLTRRISVGLRSPTVTVRGSSSRLAVGGRRRAGGEEQFQHRGRGGFVLGGSERRRRAGQREERRRGATSRAPRMTASSADLRSPVGCQAMRRHPAARRDLTSLQPVEHAGAVAELRGLRAEPLQHRQPQVVQRRLGLVADVRPVLIVPPPRPTSSTGRSSWLWRFGSAMALP